MKRKILPEKQELSETDDEAEILKQLKDKFDKSSSRSEKVQTLTVLGYAEFKKNLEPQITWFTKQLKELVKQKGILSTPNTKPGHELPKETVHLVQSFFESDEISRTMPGKKDIVSVRQGNQRVYFQKRLVLRNHTSCLRINTIHYIC